MQKWLDKVEQFNAYVFVGSVGSANTESQRSGTVMPWPPPVLVKNH